MSSTHHTGEASAPSGDGSRAPGEGSRAPGDDSRTSGDDSRASGDDSRASGDGSRTPGDDSRASGEGRLAANSAPSATAICVVIPVYNEAAHIEETCREIRRHLPPGHHLILVDDGSADLTWAALLGIARDRPAITTALRLSRNFGKEDAVCAGLDHALQLWRSLPPEARKCAIVMDGDLQHPPGEIPRMLALWEQGCKIVEARKEREARSPLHRLLTRLYLRAFQGLTGVDLDGASDYKLLDEQALRAWASLRESNPFFRGIVAWMGFRKTAITFQPARRASGRSKWSLRALLDLGFSSLVNFSALPLQLVTLTGAVFFIFALLLGVQTLYRKLAGSALDGFTTVILLQLLIGGSIMFSLGIIGTYLGKIHQGIKRRPRYLVEESAGSPPPPHEGERGRLQIEK